MEYIFTNNIRGNQTLKESFFSLARETFGIRFDLWEEKGGWMSEYIPYCYVLDDEVVANASVNLMKLAIKGFTYTAVQVGTVMTEDKHRGKGLSEKLLRRIVADYEDKVDFLYLLADSRAVPLYERVGFSTVPSVRVFGDARLFGKSENLTSAVELTLEDLMDRKKHSVPVTEMVWSTEDRHILPFYYVHGFKQLISSPIPDVLLLSEVDDKTMHIYDVITPRKVALSEVLHVAVPSGVDILEFHFMPQEKLPGVYFTTDEDGGFMVNKAGKEIYPENCCYPRIITA